MDVNAIPILKEKSHLPVIADPSHGIGIREFVEPVALACIMAGADGVMVSNHGGRGLDGALAAIDALPEVVEAVGDKVPVLMDSGVRRGTDVLKALALGATAVGIGKPVFFALAVGGEDAVVNLLQMLQREVEAAMAICGVENVADATHFWSIREIQA